MTLLARGIMVSLSAVAVFASIASSDAHAQPPHAGGAGWPTSHVSGALFGGGAPRNGGNLTVPRGDLRSAIIDNARQHAAAAPQAPPNRRRR